jgi:crossover junction endodeoxyribonuclease RuvC
MLVLGVDPGLGTTGYGLVRFQAGRSKLVEGGVIRTGDTETMEYRVGAIYEGMLEILGEYTPDIIAMEDLYSHYKHPKTAIIMGHARGAVLVAAFSKKIAVQHYPATKIKMALTGNGRARKEQVRQMIVQMLGLKQEIEPLDISDALAAALCHINQTMKVTA